MWISVSGALFSHLRKSWGMSAVLSNMLVGVFCGISKQNDNRNCSILEVDLTLFALLDFPYCRYPIPTFDFTLPGVTSMSVDVHKYGLGPKGTSVVLYRSHEIRRVPFFSYLTTSSNGTLPSRLFK
jgi:hypothetical protein